jgi:arylformamidase
MQIIDLTQTLSPQMPVYPGTEPPVFEVGCSLEADGFVEKKLSFFSHTGTHLDAPAHLLPGGRTLDQFPVGQFVGPACCLDLSKQLGRSIEVADLEPYREALAQADFCLLHTGWSRLWGSPAYFDGYPVLSTAAARWLCRFPLKGVGFDAISADPVSSADLPIHRILLGQGLVLIENLCNLDQLLAQRAIFSCLPLKLVEADGSPVRAVAMLQP